MGQMVTATGGRHPSGNDARVRVPSPDPGCVVSAVVPRVVSAASGGQPAGVRTRMDENSPAKVWKALKLPASSPVVQLASVNTKASAVV